MSTPSSSLRKIFPQLEASLKSFQSSTSKFRIVKTINPSTSTVSISPKTLFILDSSFNPPSKAHLALANSALHTSYTNQHTSPFRLLLLFSTHNADKAPSAASFPQRLAMMTIFAEDLLRDLEKSAKDDYVVPTVDIGLTTAPYYTDKSLAIAEEGTETYPDAPVHVHLMGFDTITRFLAAKYYPDHDPPLSAVSPYFESGHKLRVTLRPSKEFGTVEQQRDFVDGLGRGDMEKEGGKREWADRIDVVEAVEGVGVSSTRVRKAAKEQDWEEVMKLCTEGVGKAVKEEGVYEADDRGAKMA